MDYEKKYKEALERASKLRFQNPFDTVSQMMEHVFPELKESEDERIRKALVKLFQDCGDTDIEFCNTGFSYQEIFAWLEKQGEQKQETNYPKFTFNDVLALQCCMETVKKVQEDKDLYEKLNDLHGRVYDTYHLEKQGEQKKKMEEQQ